MGQRRIQTIIDIKVTASPLIVNCLAVSICIPREQHLSPLAPGNSTLNCVNFFNLSNSVANIIDFVWSYPADGVLAGCCDY